MIDRMRGVRRMLATLVAIPPIHEKAVPLVDGPPGRPVVRYNHNAQAGSFYPIEQAARLLSHDRVLVGPEIQEYVDDILSREWPAWRAGPSWQVRVRLDQSATVARYRGGEIIVPSPVHELVILHELAHHFTMLPTGDQHHGPLFVRAMLDLIDGVMGPDAAQVYRDVFTANGVRS